MKNICFLLLLCCFTADTYACDVCGCSVGGPYFGILPQYHRNVIGLRWYDSRVDTEHPFVHHDEQGFTSDRFRSLELWGRVNPLPRVQVLATMPYHFLTSTSGETVTRSAGLGDATLLATYALVNNVRCGNWRHQWQIGGGVKIPTGHFRSGYTDEPGLQRGTGSWDWLGSTIYTLRFRQIGLNADATWRYMGKSPSYYHYGNRFTSGVRLFYWKEWKNGPTLLPNAGLLYETAGKDVHLGELLDYTGGDCLLATAGLDVYFKGVTVGATVKIPVYEHLSEGYSDARQRLVLHAAWLF